MTTTASSANKLRSFAGTQKSKRAQQRPLKDPDVIGKSGRSFDGTISASDADTLGMILELSREPG